MVKLHAGALKGHLVYKRGVQFPPDDKLAISIQGLSGLYSVEIRALLIDGDLDIYIKRIHV